MKYSLFAFSLCLKKLLVLALSFCCLSTVIFSGKASAFNGIEKVEQTLLSYIAQSQKALTKEEQKIGNERQQLAKSINALELAVIALREKTAVARRLDDEKTLKISQLEARLENWKQQSEYQKNLMQRYLQQHNQQSQVTQLSNASEQLSAVLVSSELLAKSFFPEWQQLKLIKPDGKIKVSPTLSIGPVTWYWDERDGVAGLANQRGNTGLFSELQLSQSDSEAIANLQSNGQGDIVFDPTLTQAITRQQHSENLFSHLIKGGFWVIPILLFGLFALSIALLKVLQFWRLAPLVYFAPMALRSVMQNPQSPLAIKVKGMQRTLLDISASTESMRQREDQLFILLQQNKHKLERGIGAIAITATISPLLGLLGTVSGMIETFKMMTLFGAGDPEVISGGIAQALVTTELGLVVAILALILSAVLSRRAKSYYFELENFAMLISQGEANEKQVAPSQKTTSTKLAVDAHSTIMQQGALA